MDFLNNFLRSKKQIWIYTVIKLSLIVVIIYFSTTTEEFARKVIILAFGFVLIMSMVPVWVLHHAEMKKIEKANASKDL